MKRHRIGILDLATKAPTRALYSRVMNANLASIMPQALAVWCEEAGHDVHFICYTGFEDLREELPTDLDLLFVGAFTQSAQLAYAISHMFRQRGVVTVLGGPHARCYPDDARRYFDYVLGFTDKAVLNDVVQDCSRYRPLGIHMTAQRQPNHLPGVRERWKFISSTLSKAATSFQVVPMLGSMGCPYTCSFCIDSVVDYEPMSYDQIQEDLRFLLKRVPNPVVGWHDPNFGIRFDEYLTAIEEAVPAGRIQFIAESSLSLLSEGNVKRLSKAGFRAILPGVESWYTLGGKSKTRGKQAEEKVRHVSDHLNMIMDHIPYVQVNFVLGLDEDHGAEPFELTKRFLDRTPGAFPAYSLLTAFGEAAPLNLELQQAGRVLGFPFHFLNNNHAMNVRPKNYAWPEFYDYLIDLSEHSFSWKAIYRRFRANKTALPRWMNVVRAVSSEGFGRIKYHRQIRKLLDTDPAMRRYFDGESEEIPSFYTDRMQRDLGDFWDFLPGGAIQHDPYAYLKKTAERQDMIELPTLQQGNPSVGAAGAR